MYANVKAALKTMEAQGPKAELPYRMMNKLSEYYGIVNIMEQGNVRFSIDAERCRK